MLRQLHPLAEIAIAHKLEGLRFSLLRACREFDQLNATLREIEARSPLNVTFEECFDALGRCWSILDCAERATRLARAIPFKERTKESRRILRSLDKVREFRNNLQHLEKNADRFPDGAPPIMGALSWEHAEAHLKYHTMFLASRSLQSNFYGLTVDRQEMRFVKDYVFSVFGAEIAINDIVKLCRRYLEIVEDGLVKSGITAEGEVSPTLFAAEFRFVVPGDIHP